ncbi:MAG: sigma 54-interacting transcriptional regulator [Phycisphaeraceae bacterium]|nr:sigma 54-interacting transcriptional regulator [Phycisphaeraceae bacterium]
MENRRELELALWREACRHIDIAGSLPDLFEAIRTAVPVESMWIFAVDGPRVVLVAEAPAGPSTRRFSVSGEAARQASRFARRGGLSLVNPARPGKSLVRGLLPAVGPEHAIAGGLQRDGEAEGVVIWRLAPEQDLTDEHAESLAATLEALAVALDTSRRFHELEDLRRAAEADRQSALQRLGRASLTEPIIGASSGLKSIMDRVAMVAARDVPVLILGETGSGKEVVARAIHERSNRHEGPFLRVNCGAIPPELIDSHLFGHEKGSFTGATDQRLGWFERADNGTLFLDEIGELPLAAQVRLLRVLQEGLLERVGGQHSIRVDCRIVAATHRDLTSMVRERTFREDLWYRLAVFPLMLPPLRDRLDDLPDLVRHFADRASTRFGLPEFEVHPEDLTALRSYAWPGNIRELASVIDRAALLGQSHRLALDAALGVGGWRAPAASVPPTCGQPDAVTPLAHTVRRAIEIALQASRGRIEGAGGAAERLEVNPNTLRSKMRKLGVDKSAFR